VPPAESPTESPTESLAESPTESLAESLLVQQRERLKRLRRSIDVQEAVFVRVDLLRAVGYATLEEEGLRLLVVARSLLVAS
jgi:hypothetical protein